MVRLQSRILNPGLFQYVVLGKTSKDNARRVVLRGTEYKLRAVKFIVPERCATLERFKFEVKDGVGVFKATSLGDVRIPITSMMTLIDTRDVVTDFIEVTSSGGVQVVPIYPLSVHNSSSEHGISNL